MEHVKQWEHMNNHEKEENIRQNISLLRRLQVAYRKNNAAAIRAILKEAQAVDPTGMSESVVKKWNRAVDKANAVLKHEEDMEEYNKM